MVGYLSYLLGHSRGDYMIIPCSRTVTKQHKAFSTAGPLIWNDFPLELRSLSRTMCLAFYGLLKSFLFARAWAGSAS